MKTPMLNHTANIFHQNATALMGVVFANFGFVLDPTQATTWAAIVSAFAGVFMLMLTIYKTAIQVRVTHKSEKKLDLDIRKAELELKRLEEEEIQDDIV